MDLTGIISEYNPFHTGHQHQISAIRKQVGEESGIVCAMSGNWVQRGECAITDKWSRAEMALESGVDLVLEIPTLWAVASAERFAQGGVGVLDATGIVKRISFGSESEDINLLQAIAQCLNSDEYTQQLKVHLGRGQSFAKCRQLAVMDCLGAESGQVLEGANSNLGVEYLRAMPAEWDVLPVRRVGVAHDGGVGDGFASASQIRQWMKEESCACAGAYMTAQWVGDIATMERVERAILTRLRTMSVTDFQQLPDSSDELAVRLFNGVKTACNLEELYQGVKTKRYAHARIRRLVLNGFLDIEKRDRVDTIPYLRVLGMNEKGQKILKKMQETASTPILTKASHIRQLGELEQSVFEVENRATDLYNMCFEKIKACGQEWTRSPVIAKEKD